MSLLAVLVSSLLVGLVSGLLVGLVFVSTHRVSVWFTCWVSV